MVMGRGGPGTGSQSPQILRSKDTQAPCIKWCSFHVTPVNFKSSLHWASLVAQIVKNLPTMQEIRAQSLGWEGPLVKEIANSSIFAWRIPWTEEPGRAHTVHGVASDMTDQLSLFSCIL